MDLPLSSALSALRHANVEDLLFPLLLQLLLIILAARLFARVFRALGQPEVVGEIAAGIILGPSVLGALSPDLFAAIFQPTVSGVPPELADALFGWVLTVLSQIGLVFLLFLIGLEIDFRHLRTDGISALTISTAGIIVPFALGALLADLIHPSVAPDVPFVGFVLFIGVALSITAVPILGRIMIELGISRTRVGAVTITAAAMDDVCGWILLAAVAAVVRGQFTPERTIWMVLETFAFVAMMIFLVRPILVRGVRWVLAQKRGEVGTDTLAVVIGVVLISSMVTNRIGIFAIFGAFLCGAILSGEHAFREALTERLHRFVTVFFLPVFFTYTGLRTDVGTLHTPVLWGICGAVLFTAVLGKFGGCWVAAWVSGFSSREAVCIGTLMNTRALMGLIVINVGRDLGVTPPSVFTMLVLMALTTTVVTTPLLLWWMRGTELEPRIRDVWSRSRNGSVEQKDSLDPSMTQVV